MMERMLTNFALAYMADHPECRFEDMADALHDELLWEIEALESEGAIDCKLCNRPYVTYRLKEGKT